MLKERWNAALEWSEGLLCLLEASLHVGSYFGIGHGDAVTLRNAPSLVVEFFVIPVIEVYLRTAKVGLLDIFPLLRANANDVLVVEEQNFVMRRGCALGQNLGDIAAIENYALRKAKFSHTAKGRQEIDAADDRVGLASRFDPARRPRNEGDTVATVISCTSLTVSQGAR